MNEYRLRLRHGAYHPTLNLKNQIETTDSAVVDLEGAPRVAGAEYTSHHTLLPPALPS